MAGMKDSLIIVLFFSLGILLAYFNLIPDFVLIHQWNNWVLFILLFVVGIGIGSNKEALSIIYKANWKIILVPITIIIGSLGSTALYALFIKDICIKEAMAVGAGFGYYSLSSVLISKIHGSLWGTIGLISNIIREILTLILAPLLVTIFGKLAPIAAGGATAMDTTLPIITKTSGLEYSVVAIFSGLILTLAVPVLVTFILSF